MNIKNILAIDVDEMKSVDEKAFNKFINSDFTLLEDKPNSFEDAFNAIFVGEEK